MKTNKTITPSIRYADRGTSLARSGNYREAGNLLAHAIKVEPFSAQLLCTMADVQCKLGNYAFAFEYYRRAQESNPRLPEVYMSRALMHLELERLSLARADIERAELLVHCDSRICLLKAQYLLQLGQVEQSRAQVFLALEMDPKSVAGLLLMAAIQERRGRWEDALEMYDRILHEIDPLSRLAAIRRQKILSRFCRAA